MPFTVSPSSYRGGDYLFQGITNAAGSLTDALKHYQDIADQADQADATMGYLHQQIDPVTGKPVIDDKAFQSFQQHNQRQRAHIGGGIFAGMKLMETLQHLGYAGRESLAHTNYYQAEAQRARAQAESEGAGGGAGPGKIWSNELGGYATPAQAKRAYNLSPAGVVQNNYGVTPADIFNSKIHEAGTVTTDPSTGAKTFKNDPAGDQIRIGGATGVTMPRVEHEIFKRQLTMAGQAPDAAAGGPAGAGPAGGGAQDQVQAQAIAILQQNGKPLTPANINWVIQNKLSGGQ
jgi:hypothetical protein